MSLLILDPTLLEKIKANKLEAYKRDPAECANGEDVWVIWRNGVPVNSVSGENLSKQDAFIKYFEKIEAK